LWTNDFIVNAERRYTYDLSSINYEDGSATITINSSNYSLSYDGSVQGLANALNSLNFGYFLVSGETIYTQDDTNVYGNFTFPTAPLTLSFSSISSADTLVGDAYDVGDWNTFFALPTYGNSFTSVAIAGTDVKLYGGSNINVKPGLMYANKNNTFLLGITDKDGSIISVSGDSFSYCLGLKKALLYGCVTIYGRETSPYNDRGAFGVCSNLNNVKLPKVVTIGGYSFQNSLLIGNIDFPELVTVEDFAFFICGISTQNFPKVVSVGNNSFRSCNSLTSISFPLCTSVSDYGFYQCVSITTINFPIITTINSYCFAENPKLTSVNMPLLQSCGSGLFGQCTSLVTISLPLLTTIRGVLFQFCTKLKNVSLPEAQNMNPIPGLGGGNFLFCSSLETITLPKATSTRQNEFYGCTLLNSVNLPLSTILGINVFRDCTSLTSILLPSCSNLGGSVGDNNVFNGITGKTITLTIPASRMTANGGNPDGDIQYLQANNTVTVVTT
jgi:hypothetical protein